MLLNDIWFVLFVVIIAGYLILDGFDMGVGMLHIILARTDAERRVLLNSIGPVWDGNEVWLILGGGVLFAAFPLVYASLFSGFYLAMMAVLLVMILRTVAIEFRSKRESPRWRSTWDFIFWISSLGLALLLGVAFGNVISGVTLDARGNINMTLFDLLTPFALLVGVTTVTMFAMHGAIFLTMKTDGDLQARIRRAIPKLMVVFFVLNTLTVIGTVAFRQEITQRYLAEIWPVIFPAAALIALIVAWRMLRTGHEFWAFVSSGTMIAMLLISGAIGMFPNLLISTIDPQFNLTIYNAASAPNTLTVMLVIALIGMPLVLLYTTGVYYFFRGKTIVEPKGY
jgi:cytochrome bd ubiquinol oxidase subunit II